MSRGRFGIDPEALLDKVYDIANYVKSGILINSIEPVYKQLFQTKLLAPFYNLIETGVFIDIPSREIVVAILEDDDEKYLLLIEWYLYERSTVSIAPLDDDNYKIAKDLIEGILDWARNNQETIRRIKRETLNNILKELPEPSRKELEEFLNKVRNLSA